MGVACGGASPLSTSIVETPSSKVETYGAPRDVTYSVEVDPALNEARLTVYQRATCDVISVQLVDRYEEKRRGDEVVERTLLGKGQHAGPVTGKVPCAQTYAARVLVIVDAGAAHFTLGETDARGRIAVRWNEVFKTATMGVPSEPATILVRPQQAQPTVSAGSISFQELTRQEQRLAQLIGDLSVVLDRAAGSASPTNPAHLSQADSRQAYELYAQLQQLAPNDPRTVAIATRFWELVYARKQTESEAALGRNLEALSKAKDTLKIMGNAAIPLYVQAAVSSGTLDARTLEWSSLRLISALQGGRALCVGGSLVNASWPTPEARLAAQYFEYGYGASAQTRFTSICSTLW